MLHHVESYPQNRYYILSLAVQASRMKCLVLNPNPSAQLGWTEFLYLAHDMSVIQCHVLYPVQLEQRISYKATQELQGVV